MTTITLWLLMSAPVGYAYSHGASAAAPAVLERFATKPECQRVAEVLTSFQRGNAAPVVFCIQTTTLKP